jgi:LSD1 subclass zinc finger protein
MQRRPANTNSKVRAAMVGLFVLVAALSALYSSLSGPQTLAQSRRTVTRPAATRYSSFPHDTKSHRMECSTCHKFPSANWDKVRSKENAFPDITEYPRHDSCVGCHRQQFFRGARPVICSICHTTPGPRGEQRHPFPNPREVFDTSAKGKTAESDFEISFSHEKHVDIVADRGTGRASFRNVLFTRSRRADENCAVCHVTMQPQGDSPDEFVTKPPASVGDGFWLKKGMFKSVPTGHTTCFTCHSTDSGIEPAPTNCAVCHKIRRPPERSEFDQKLASSMGPVPKVTLDAWKRRDSAGAFRHEFSSHAELSCDTCHNAKAMDTLDTKSKLVPISSCATCHVTATVDDGGVLNYEMQKRKSDPGFQCTKCHVTLGKLPLPQSHTQAVVEAGGKP